MHNVIRAGTLSPNANGTVLFEGEAYGSGVSCFLLRTAPGKGPDLHVHPYSETWIVRAGQARFTADGETLDVGPGDIVVATAGTIHGFKNTGTELLDMICIHDSPKLIQRWIEDESAAS